MKFCVKNALVALQLILLLPLCAQPENRADQAAGPRAYMGMVVDELSVPHVGLLVRAVAPGSPAYKAGIRKGDIVLSVGNNPLRHRAELRKLVASGAPGDSYLVQLQRASQVQSLHVVLETRPAASVSRFGRAAAMSSDRSILPIAIPADIRKEMRRARQRICEQLAVLPDGMDCKLVTRELQAIRNLARDANAGRAGWMSGRAGEISIRFTDEQGSIVLHGASNVVTLELYGADGQLIESYILNNEPECHSLPEGLLQRLRRLR